MTNFGHQKELFETEDAYENNSCHFWQQNRRLLIRKEFVIFQVQ